MDDNTREKLRPVLYLAAGAYLIYLAVHMLQGLGEIAGTEHTVMLVGAIVFAVGGAGILIFGLYCAKKVFLDPPENESPEEHSEEKSEEQE